MFDEFDEDKFEILLMLFDSRIVRKGNTVEMAGGDIYPFFG